MGGVNIDFNLSFLSSDPTSVSQTRSLFSGSRGGMPGALPVWYARFRPYKNYKVGQVVQKVSGADDLIPRDDRPRPSKFNLYVCILNSSGNLQSGGGVSDASFSLYFKSFYTLESDYSISTQGGMRAVSKNEWATGGRMDDNEICLNLSEFVTMDKLICFATLIPLEGKDLPPIKLTPVSEISFGGGSARTASPATGEQLLERYIVDFPEYGFGSGDVSQLPDRRFGFSSTSLNAVMGASFDFLEPRQSAEDNISGSSQWNPSLDYSPGNIVSYSPPLLADIDNLSGWSEEFNLVGFPSLAMCKKQTDGPVKLEGGGYSSAKTPWYGSESGNFNEYWVKYDAQINRPNSSLASIYKYFAEKKFEITKFSHDQMKVEENLAGQSVKRREGRIRMTDFTGSSNILGHLLVKFAKPLNRYSRDKCRSWWSGDQSDTGPVQDGGLDLFIYTKTLRKDHGGQPRLAVTFGSTTAIKFFSSHGASSFSTSQISRSKLNSYLQNLDFNELDIDTTPSSGDLVHFQYRNLTPFFYMGRGYVHARRRGGVHPGSSKGSRQLGKYLMMVEDLLSRQRIEFITPQIFSNGNMYVGGHGALSGMHLDHGQPKSTNISYDYNINSNTNEDSLTELLSAKTATGNFHGGYSSSRSYSAGSVVFDGGIRYKATSTVSAGGSPPASSTQWEARSGGSANPGHYLILGNKLNRQDQVNNAGQTFLYGTPKKYVDAAFLPILKRTDEMSDSDFSAALGLLQTGFKGFKGGQFGVLTESKEKNRLDAAIDGAVLDFEASHFIDLGESDLQQESIFSLTVDRSSYMGNVEVLDAMIKWDNSIVYGAGHMTRVSRDDWWLKLNTAPTDATAWRQDSIYNTTDKKNVYVYQDDGEKTYYESKQDNNRDFSPLQKDLFFKAKVRMVSPGEDPISGGAPAVPGDPWGNTKWTRLSIVGNTAIAPLSMVTQITLYDGWVKIFDSFKRGLSGSPDTNNKFPIVLGFEWYKSLDGEGGLGLMSERTYDIAPWNTEESGNYKVGDLVTMKEKTPTIPDPSSGAGLTYQQWAALFPTTASTPYLDSAEYLFLRADSKVPSYCFQCIKDTDSEGIPTGVGIVPGIFPRESESETAYFVAHLTEDLFYSKFKGKNIYSETTWLEVSQAEFDNEIIDSTTGGRLYAEHYGLEGDGGTGFKIQRRDLFGANNYAYDLTFENYYRIGDAVKMAADECRVKIRQFHYVADVPAGFALVENVSSQTAIKAQQYDSSANSYSGLEVYKLPVSIASGTISGFTSSYSLVIRPGDYWQPVARQEFELDRTYPSPEDIALGEEVQYFLTEGDFDFIHKAKGSSAYAVQAVYGSRLSLFGPRLKTYDATNDKNKYWRPEVRYPTTSMIEAWDPTDGTPELDSPLYLATLDYIDVSFDEWGGEWREGGALDAGILKFTATANTRGEDHPLSLSINDPNLHPAVSVFRSWLSSTDSGVDFNYDTGFNLDGAASGDINPIKLHKLPDSYPPEIQLEIEIYSGGGTLISGPQVYGGEEINITSTQTIKIIPKLLNVEGDEFPTYKGFVSSLSNANVLGEYTRQPILTSESYSDFGLSYGGIMPSSHLVVGEPAVWGTKGYDLSYVADEEVIWDKYVWRAKENVDSVWGPGENVSENDSWEFIRPAEYASRIMNQIILDEECLLADDFSTNNRIEYLYIEQSHKNSSTLRVEDGATNIGLIDAASTTNSSGETVVKLREFPKWKTVNGPEGSINAWTIEQSFDQGDFTNESGVIYYAKRASSSFQPSLFDSLWQRVDEWSNAREYNLGDIVYRKESSVVWNETTNSGDMPTHSELSHENSYATIFYSCLETHNTAKLSQDSFNPSAENILDATHGESEFLLRPFDNISNIFDNSGLNLKLSFDMESVDTGTYKSSTKELTITLFSEEDVDGNSFNDVDLFEYVFNNPTVLRGNLGFVSEFKLNNQYGGLKSTAITPISVKIENTAATEHALPSEEYLDIPNKITKTYAVSAGLGWQNRFIISDGNLYASGMDSSELGYLGISNYKKKDDDEATWYGSTLEWNLETYGRHHMCAPLKDATDGDGQRVKIYVNGSVDDLLDPQPEANFVRSGGGNTVFITTDGELYGFGKNENNSLGITDKSFTGGGSAATLIDPEQWGDWSHDLVDAADRFDLLSYANQCREDSIADNKDDPHLAGWFTYLTEDHNLANPEPPWERMAWALFPMNWSTYTNAEKNAYLRDTVDWIPEAGLYSGGATPWWASEDQLRIAGRILPWYDNVNFWKTGGVECVGFDKADNGTNLILNSEDYIPFVRETRFWDDDSTSAGFTWGHREEDATYPEGAIWHDGISIKQSWEFYGGGFNDVDGSEKNGEQNRIAREAPLLAGFEGEREQNMAGAAVLNDRGWMAPAWIFPYRDNPDTANALSSWLSSGPGDSYEWEEPFYFYPTSKWDDGDYPMASREWGTPDWSERSWWGPNKNKRAMCNPYLLYGATAWSSATNYDKGDGVFNGGVFTEFGSNFTKMAGIWYASENITAPGPMPGTDDKWIHRPDPPLLDLPYGGSLKNHCVIDYFHDSKTVTYAELDSNSWSEIPTNAAPDTEYLAVAIYRLKDRENYSYGDRPAAHSLFNNDAYNTVPDGRRLAACRNAPGVPFPVKLTDETVVWAAANANSTVYVTDSGDVKILGSITGCKDMPVQGLDFHSDATHGKVEQKTTTFSNFDPLGELEVDLLWQNDNWGLIHHMTDRDPDPFAGGEVGKYGSRVLGNITYGETWEPYLPTENYLADRYVSYQGSLWKKLTDQASSSHSEPGVITGEWENLDHLEATVLETKAASDGDFNNLNSYFLHKHWPNTGPAYVATGGNGVDIHRVKEDDWGSIKFHGGEVIREDGTKIDDPSLGIAGAYRVDPVRSAFYADPSGLNQDGAYKVYENVDSDTNLMWFWDGKWRASDKYSWDNANYDTQYAYGEVETTVDRTPADVSMWYVITSRQTHQEVDIYDTGAVEKAGYTYPNNPNITADAVWNVNVSSATYSGPDATFGSTWVPAAWVPSDHSLIGAPWVVPPEGTHWVSAAVVEAAVPYLGPQSQPTFAAAFEIADDVDTTKISISLDFAVDDILFDVRIKNTSGNHSINPELNYKKIYHKEFLTNWDFNESLRGYGNGDFVIDDDGPWRIAQGWRPHFSRNWTANTWMWPKDWPDTVFTPEEQLSGEAILAENSDSELRWIYGPQYDNPNAPLETHTKFTEELEVGDQVSFYIPWQALPVWVSGPIYDHGDFVQHNGKAWAVRHLMGGTPTSSVPPGTANGAGNQEWSEWPDGIPIGIMSPIKYKLIESNYDGLARQLVFVTEIKSDSEIAVQIKSQGGTQYWMPPVERYGPTSDWRPQQRIEGAKIYKSSLRGNWVNWDATDGTELNVPGVLSTVFDSYTHARDKYWFSQHRSVDKAEIWGDEPAPPFEAYRSGNKGGSTPILPAYTAWGAFTGVYPTGSEGIVGAEFNMPSEHWLSPTGGGANTSKAILTRRGMLFPGVGSHSSFGAFASDALDYEIMDRSGGMYFSDILDLSFNDMKGKLGAIGPHVADLACMGIYNFAHGPQGGTKGRALLVYEDDATWGKLMNGSELRSPNYWWRWGLGHYGGHEYWWALETGGGGVNDAPTSSLSYGGYEGNTSDGSGWGELHLVPWGYDYVPGEKQPEAGSGDGPWGMQLDIDSGYSSTYGFALDYPDNNINPFSLGDFEYELEIPRHHTDRAFSQSGVGPVIWLKRSSNPGLPDTTAGGLAWDNRIVPGVRLQTSSGDENIVITEVHPETPGDADYGYFMVGADLDDDGNVWWDASRYGYDASRDPGPLAGGEWTGSGGVNTWVYPNSPNGGYDTVNPNSNDGPHPHGGEVLGQDLSGDQVHVGANCTFLGGTVSEITPNHKLGTASITLKHPYGTGDFAHRLMQAIIPASINHFEHGSAIGSKQFGPNTAKPLTVGAKYEVRFVYRSHHNLGQALLLARIHIHHALTEKPNIVPSEASSYLDSDHYAEVAGVEVDKIGDGGVWFRPTDEREGDNYVQGWKEGAFTFIATHTSHSIKFTSMAQEFDAANSLTNPKTMTFIYGVRCREAPSFLSGGLGGFTSLYIGPKGIGNSDIFTTGTNEIYITIKNLGTIAGAGENWNPAGLLTKNLSVYAPLALGVEGATWAQDTGVKTEYRLTYNAGSDAPVEIGEEAEGRLSTEMGTGTLTYPLANYSRDLENYGGYTWYGDQTDWDFYIETWPDILATRTNDYPWMTPTEFAKLHWTWPLSEADRASRAGGIRHKSTLERRVLSKSEWFRNTYTSQTYMRDWVEDPVLGYTFLARSSQATNPNLPSMGAGDWFYTAKYGQWVHISDAEQAKKAAGQRFICLMSGIGIDFIAISPDADHYTAGNARFPLIDGELLESTAFSGDGSYSSSDKGIFFHIFVRPSSGIVVKAVKPEIKTQGTWHIRHSPGKTTDTRTVADWNYIVSTKYWSGSSSVEGSSPVHWDWPENGGGDVGPNGHHEAIDLELAQGYHTFYMFHEPWPWYGSNDGKFGYMGSSQVGVGLNQAFHDDGNIVFYAGWVLDNDCLHQSVNWPSVGTGWESFIKWSPRGFGGFIDYEVSTSVSVDPDYQSSTISKSSYDTGDVVTAEVADGTDLFGTLVFISMKDDNTSDIGFGESLERVDGKKWTMPAPKAITKTYYAASDEHAGKNTAGSLIDNISGSALVNYEPYTLYNHQDYGDDKALQVEAGADHILIRTTSGKVFGVGDNSQQQIDWRNKTGGMESDFDFGDRLGRNSPGQGFYELGGTATSTLNPMYDSSWSAIEQPGLPPEKWAYGKAYSPGDKVWIDHISHTVYVGPGQDADGTLLEGQLQISIPSLTENGELESLDPLLLKLQWAGEGVNNKLGKWQKPDVEVLTFGSVGEAMNALISQENADGNTFENVGLFGWFPLGRLSMIPNDGATHVFPAVQIKMPVTSNFKLYKKAFGDTYFGTREVFLRPHLISYGSNNNQVVPLDEVAAVAASGNNSLILSESGDLFGTGENKVSGADVNDYELRSLGNVFGLESEFLDGPEFIFPNVEFISLQVDCATFISEGRSYKCGGVGLRPYLENYSFKGAPAVILDDTISREGEPIIAKQVFMDSFGFWSKPKRRIRAWPQIISGKLCRKGSTAIQDRILPEINWFADAWVSNKSYQALTPSGHLEYIRGDHYDGVPKTTEPGSGLGFESPNDVISGLSSEEGIMHANDTQMGSAFIGREPDFVTHRGQIYQCLEGHVSGDYLLSEPGTSSGARYWRESSSSQINVGAIQYFYREWQLDKWATMSYIDENGNLLSKGFQTMYEPSIDAKIHQGGKSYTSLRSNAATWASERISGWHLDLDHSGVVAIPGSHFSLPENLYLYHGGQDNELLANGGVFGDRPNPFFGDDNTNILSAENVLDCEYIDFTHSIMGSFVSGANRPSTRLDEDWVSMVTHVVNNKWSSSGNMGIGWGSYDPFAPSFIRDFNKSSRDWQGEHNTLDLYFNAEKHGWWNNSSPEEWDPTFTSQNPPHGMYNWWQVMSEMKIGDISDSGLTWQNWSQDSTKGILDVFQFMREYQGPSTYNWEMTASSALTNVGGSVGHPEISWRAYSKIDRIPVSPIDFSGETSFNANSYSLFGGDFWYRFNEDAWIVGNVQQSKSQSAQFGIGPDSEGYPSPKNPRLDDTTTRGKLTKIIGLQNSTLGEGIPYRIQDPEYHLLLTGHNEYQRMNFAAGAMFGSWMCDPWSLPFGKGIRAFFHSESILPHKNVWPGDRVNYRGTVYSRVYSAHVDGALNFSNVDGHLGEAPLDSPTPNLYYEHTYDGYGDLRSKSWAVDRLEKEHRWRTQISAMHQVMLEPSQFSGDPYRRAIKHFGVSIGHSQIYTGFAERIGGHCLEFDWSDREEKGGGTSLAVDYLHRVAGLDKRDPSNFSGLSEFDAFDVPGWNQRWSPPVGPMKETIELTDTQGYTFVNRETGSTWWLRYVAGGYLELHNNMVARHNVNPNGAPFATLNPNTLKPWVFDLHDLYLSWDFWTRLKVMVGASHSYPSFYLAGVLYHAGNMLPSGARWYPSADKYEVNFGNYYYWTRTYLPANSAGSVDQYSGYYRFPKRAVDFGFGPITDLMESYGQLKRHGMSNFTTSIDEAHSWRGRENQMVSYCAQSDRSFQYDAFSVKDFTKMSLGECIKFIWENEFKEGDIIRIPTSPSVPVRESERLWRAKGDIAANTLNISALKASDKRIVLTLGSTWDNLWQEINQWDEDKWYSHGDRVIWHGNLWMMPYEWTTDSYPAGEGGGTSLWSEYSYPSIRGTLTMPGTTGNMGTFEDPIPVAHWIAGNNHAGIALDEYEAGKGSKFALYSAEDMIENWADKPYSARANRELRFELAERFINADVVSAYDGSASYSRGDLVHQGNSGAPWYYKKIWKFNVSYLAGPGEGENAPGGDGNKWEYVGQHGDSLGWLLTGAPGSFYSERYSDSGNKHELAIFWANLGGLSEEPACSAGTSVGDRVSDGFIVEQLALTAKNISIASRGSKMFASEEAAINWVIRRAKEREKLGFSWYDHKMRKWVAGRNWLWENMNLERIPAWGGSLWTLDEQDGIDLAELTGDWSAQSYSTGDLVSQEFTYYSTVYPCVWRAKENTDSTDVPGPLSANTTNWHPKWEFVKVDHQYNHGERAWWKGELYECRDSVWTNGGTTSAFPTNYSLTSQFENDHNYNIYNPEGLSHVEDQHGIAGPAPNWVKCGGGSYKSPFIDSFYSVMGDAPVFNTVQRGGNLAGTTSTYHNDYFDTQEEAETFARSSHPASRNPQYTVGNPLADRDGYIGRGGPYKAHPGFTDEDLIEIVTEYCGENGARGPQMHNHPSFNKTGPGDCKVIYIGGKEHSQCLARMRGICDSWEEKIKDALPGGAIAPNGELFLAMLGSAKYKDKWEDTGNNVDID